MLSLLCLAGESSSSVCSLSLFLVSLPCLSLSLSLANRCSWLFMGVSPPTHSAAMLCLCLLQSVIPMHPGHFSLSFHSPLAMMVNLSTMNLWQIYTPC